MNRHPHFLLTTLTALSVLLHGCTRDDAAGDPYAPGHYISVVMEAEAEEGGGAPTLESVRLVVFNSQGVCVGNEAFGRDDCTYMLKKPDSGRDYWEVRMSAPMRIEAEVKNDRYDIYAVLNENGFCSNIDENTSLGDRLADEGLDRASFLGLLDTPLLYDGQHPDGSGTEPAFVMCAYKTGVAIPGSATFKNPYWVHLDQAQTGNRPVDRTMAMISVNRIAGDEKPGENPVSRILVTDVSLVNVPMRYLWNNDAGNDIDDMTTVAVDGKTTETVDKDAVFYDRGWDGSVTQAVTGNCRQHGTADDNARLYRVKASNGGSDVWVVKTDVASAPAPVMYSTWNDKSKYTANAGSYHEYLKAVFSTGGELGGDSGIMTWEDMDVTLNPQEAAIKGGDWNVGLDRALYVPENIAYGRESATCLRIKLALAEPVLNDFHFTEDITWDTDDITIYVDGQDVKDKLGGNKPDPFFEAHAKACYANDIYMVEGMDGFVYSTNQNENYKYYYFVGGFTADRYGSVTKTFTTDPELTGPGVTLTTESWKIDHDTETEFIVPINNNIDNRNGQAEDYSIYRNTKYAITVRVNAAAYEILNSKGRGAGTRGGQRGAPPVTLQVETAGLYENNR